MNNKMRSFFKDNGNFKIGQDPYRNQNNEFYHTFFEDDYLSVAAITFLEKFIHQKGIEPMCDAVKMLVADRFANNTKGNYSTIYLWR